MSAIRGYPNAGAGIRLSRAALEEVQMSTQRAEVDPSVIAALRDVYDP